jgi:hypothetical protein
MENVKLMKLKLLDMGHVQIKAPHQNLCLWSLVATLQMHVGSIFQLGILHVTYYNYFFQLPIGASFQ